MTMVGGVSIKRVCYNERKKLYKVFHNRVIIIASPPVSPRHYSVLPDSAVRKEKRCIVLTEKEHHSMKELFRKNMNM